MKQKLFFSDINTGKTLPKNCRNLSTSLKCFACIYYHWKKFLVQSVYVKWRTLISLYIADTLVEPNRETPSLKPNLLKKNNLSIRIEKNYYFTLPSNTMQCNVNSVNRKHMTLCTEGKYVALLIQDQKNICAWARWGLDFTMRSDPFRNRIKNFLELH